MGEFFFVQLTVVLFSPRLNGQQRTWKLKSTSARERAVQYQPGQKIHGFTVREVGVMAHFHFRGYLCYCS